MRIGLGDNCLKLQMTECLGKLKQIHEYNDLIFGAAGNRLVYSDLRSGVIVPWAFPAENDIQS